MLNSFGVVFSVLVLVFFFPLDATQEKKGGKCARIGKSDLNDMRIMGNDT